MNSANPTDHLVQTLYLTFVHSLWQGALLAAVAGLIMISTRRAAAAKRYNLLIAALLLFAAGSVFTFSRTWGSLQQASNTIASPVTPEMLPATTVAGLHPEPGSFVESLVTFFNTNAANIVLLWFVVICIRSLQLALGLRGIRRLRHTAVPADLYWQHYLNQLADRTGIRRAVGLAESALAKVPVVIGHFKPLVLIPAGLITALPAAELEAILVHELAHIRRRDYMVNLLQSLMEIIFFFNPAIWWLSSLIRAEREHCCDDIVLQQTSSKKNYIQALVSCEEYQLPARAYAMALSSNKKNLTTRVKRIISNNNASLNLMEKSMLAVCLVAAGILMVAFTNKNREQAPDTAKENQEIVATVAADSPDREVLPEPVAYQSDVTAIAPPVEAASLPDPATTVPAPLAAPLQAPEADPANISLSGAMSAGIYQGRLQKRQEKVKECISESDKNLEEARAIARRNREEALATARQRRADAMALARNNQAEAYAEARKRTDEARAMMRVQRQQAMTLTEARNNQERALAESRRRSDEAQARARVLQQKAQARAREQQDAARKKYDEAMRQHDDAMRQHDEALRKHNEALRKHDEAIRKNEQARREQELSTNVILSEMVKDGLVKKKDDDLEFKLNDSEFIVNDVKQPEPLFRKYKEKYLKVNGKAGTTRSVHYQHRSK